VATVVTTQLSQLTKSLATQLLLIQQVLYGLVSVFMTLASGWRNVWIVGGQGPPFSHTYFPFSIQLLPRNSQKSERVCATSLFAAHATRQILVAHSAANIWLQVAAPSQPYYI